MVLLKKSCLPLDQGQKMHQGYSLGHQMVGHGQQSAFREVDGHLRGQKEFQEALALSLCRKQETH